MKQLLIVFAVLLVSSFVFGQDFNYRIGVGLLTHDPINEASGLAASSKNPGILWCHNDSGSNQIYAMDSTGVHYGVYTLGDTTIRDIEDIAVGPGPTPMEQYIYIGDIGDNSGSYTDKYIYRMIEPTVVAPGDATISGIETITIQYPAPNNYDSETLLLDPISNDIYVVTKSKYPAAGPSESDMVFMAAYPQSTSDTIIMTQVATLTIPHFLNPLDSNYYGSTGGDVSRFGTEILIRTYDGVYHWERTLGDPLWMAFSNRSYYTCPYSMIAAPPEPQGEAICWDITALGYFTTSEEPNSPFPPYEPIPANLSYASRNDDPPLPVTLSSFIGYIENGLPTLNWTTQSETNNLGWNVYRAQTSGLENAMQLNYSLIPGAGTSTEPTNYMYEDESDLISETTYWYWLESVSGNGETENYNPITLTVPSENDDTPDLPDRTELYGNYPNPFNPKTEIKFDIKEGETGELTILNVKGQEVCTMKYEAGSHFFTWEGSKIGSGVYFYQLETPSYNKIEKMVMIK